MGKQLFSNAARSLLGVGINSVETSLTIQSGGDKFPVVANGDWITLTLEDANGIEIIYCQAHTSASTTFSSLVRGQEGTAARNWAAGAAVGLRLTANDFGWVSQEKVVASVAELQAAPLRVGDIVKTLGYNTPGDGGGATYEIVSGSTVIGYDEPNIQAYNLLPAWAITNFSNGNWTRNGLAAYNASTETNQLLAPDGTVSADFIREDTTTTGHNIYLALATPITGPQEAFFYVAKYGSPGAVNSRPYAWAQYQSGAAYSSTIAMLAVIDLTTGAATLVSAGSGLTNPRVVTVDAGNYWLVRLQCSTTVTGVVLLRMAASNTYSTTVYTGDGTSGIYLWGWGIRPLITPGIVLANALQAKPLLNNTVRLSQFGATTNADNNALFKAMSYFGTNQGTLIIDAPTSFTQPSNMATLTIPSNVTLRFEGPGALTGVTNMTVNSRLIADNRAILPKTLATAFGPQQRSIPSTWFGL